MIAVAALAANVGTTAAARQQATPAPAPPVPPLIREGVTEKITSHVYVIPDNSVPMVPNVGIVVGSRATLVIDTGLGTRNGATVMREVAKVSTNTELYLVTTGACNFACSHCLSGSDNTHTSFFNSAMDERTALRAAVLPLW